MTQEIKNTKDLLTAFEKENLYAELRKGFYGLVKQVIVTEAGSIVYLCDGEKGLKESKELTMFLSFK